MDSDFEEIRKLPEIKDPLAVFTILESELKGMVTLMKKFQVRGDARKYTAIAIVSEPLADKAILSGALFSQHFPTHKIKNCVRHLRVDPFNSKSRIEMLELLRLYPSHVVQPYSIAIVRHFPNQGPTLPPPYF